MPKTPEFATWVSNMANSIPDSSTWIKPSNYSKPTKMQTRMMFADMLIPLLCDNDAAYSWMRAFLAVLESDLMLVGSAIEIIGLSKADEYYAVEEEGELQWVLQFRKDIDKGWTPKDI